MHLLRRLWLPLAYYVSWLLFGLGGLALSLASAPLCLFPRRESHGLRARAAARRMLALWLGWMRVSGVVAVTFRNFSTPPPRGVIYVANHPTLVDAPLLLARLTDTICIFKPALLRHPCIGPAAILAGHVSGDRGVDVVRHAAARVAAGRSLLVFPEGTRTAPGSALNPLRPGFALIARRARAPIQLIHVRAGPLVARKGHPWWKVPPLPGRWEFTLGERIPPDAAVTTAALHDRVLNALRAGPAPA